MNRNDEYMQLMQATEEGVPELGASIMKAYKRRGRKRLLIRTLASAATICGLFVLLVNVYTPFANLCAKTPVLKTLAAAVTVERGWPDEVVEQEEEKGKDASILLGKYIEASVETMKVTGKSVEVSIRIGSTGYDEMTAWIEVLGASDGNPYPSRSIFPTSFDEHSFAVKNGELHTLTIDYSMYGLPQHLPIWLFVHYDKEAAAKIDPAKEVLAENVVMFSFDLSLKNVSSKEPSRAESYYSSSSLSYRIYPMNQEIDIDGEKVALTKAVMDDRKISIEATQPYHNTGKLVDIIAYTKTPSGKLREIEANDQLITLYVGHISAELESFNSGAWNAVDMIIKGAYMLEQEREKVYVNLVTGETGKLPDGVELYKTYKEDGTWVVEMRTPCWISEDETLAPQEIEIMDMRFYDNEGKEYVVYGKSGYFEDYYRGAGYTYVEVLKLEDYPYDEVWLEMEFSHLWEPEKEIAFTFVQ